MSISKKNLYIIGYGLGGGFGGINTYEVINAPNQEAASKDAYWKSVEEYESYEGMHGLRTLYDCIEEAEGSEEVGQEIYNEELETWIEYTCFPWSKEEEKICKSKGHYYNSYKNITNVKEAGETKRANKK